MKRILVIGGGFIGSAIAYLLANSGDYQVIITDLHPGNKNLQRIAKIKHIEIQTLDVQDQPELEQFIEKNNIEAVVSSLPYHANMPVALAAKKYKLPYFDLTEDVSTANAIKKIAHNAPNPFVPQCGLAPGFISIVANALIKHFPVTVDSIKLRVGALPTNISNALQYSLTWSIDGLINEYGNPCEGIDEGHPMLFLPLDDLEEIKIDGVTYEAFNTSGGVGTLVESYHGMVKHLSYKTIRYPGHCAKMRFLMNDLNLNKDRDTLKAILSNAIPRTNQDVVLVYVSVTGRREGQYMEENYVKKFYPQEIDGLTWSAIQLTTASALCAALDLVMLHPSKYCGFVKQEDFSLKEFSENRFGEMYASTGAG